MSATDLPAPILPGATLGVLGGGQLGRMFGVAARQMGYRLHVFVPDEDSPAGQIADSVTLASYDDLDAIERFARGVDAITFEFENVASAAAEAAAKHVPVRPAGSLLHATQNRGREKHALSSLGIPVAPFVLIEEEAALEAAAETVGLPAVLKTTAWGYDGRGQWRIHTLDDLRQAWVELAGVPAVLEQLIPFTAELSVVGARGIDGQVALYEPVLNRHENHILDVTLCPAPVPERVAKAALDLARQVLTELEVVGVLCVELFLLADGGLLVNELAPRPHNSGHITLDAHVCSQFEQQVRALCALPLGSTERCVPAGVMVNLLGDLWQDGEPEWQHALVQPRTSLHLYGKSGPRVGRKMGHISVTADTLEDAERLAVDARSQLTLKGQPSEWTGA